MAEVYNTYIPAAGHHWMPPFYQPLVRLLGGNSARAALENQAAPDRRVTVPEENSHA